MLQAVDRNPLPASIEISLAARFQTEPEARRLVAEIQSLHGVENVEYSREWLATLERARAYVLGGAVVLGIICILVLYFVVSNTVKLTIYARKDVVTTMRFVGATDAYIATPFVLEGILQGAVGATISAGALWLLQMLAGPMLAAKVPVVVFPILVAMGVAFGWLGSTSAIRRFLD
jgi:cell division transport system permease protein